MSPRAHIRRTYLIATAVILCVSSTAHADWIQLSAHPDGGMYQDEQLPATPGIFRLYVYVWHFQPSNGVTFSVPADPEFPGIWLYDEAVFPATTGLSPNAVTVQYGECKTGLTHVLTMVYLMPEGVDVDCATIGAGSGGNAARCDGNSWDLDPAWDINAYVSTLEPHVYDRFPADGATSVPIDTKISWREAYCEWAYIQFDWCLFGCPPTVYFGTDPNPPLYQPSPGYNGPFPAEDMEPCTTYYWRFEPVYVYWETMPVWSVTTGGPLATEAKTWGAIKALYR